MKFTRINQYLFNTDHIRKAWIDKKNNKQIELIWASGEADHIECEGPEEAQRILNTIYSQGNQAPQKLENNRSKPKLAETKRKPE